MKDIEDIREIITSALVSDALDALGFAHQSLGGTSCR